MACGMNLYLTNATGAALTLQNVVLVNIGAVGPATSVPGVMHVVPAGAAPQLIAWADLWGSTVLDTSTTISFNCVDGTVLNITYTGGSLGQINTSFVPSNQTGWEAQPSVYQNGLLISLTPQDSGASQ